MQLRYDFAALAALATAAAVLTASADYVLGIEKNLDALTLRMAAAFTITVFIIAVARRLFQAPAPGSSEERPRPDRECLPSVSVDRQGSATDQVILRRLGDEISACNPIIFTLCDHVQDVVTNTEDVAMNILTKLNGVDRTITELVGFLKSVHTTRFYRSWNRQNSAFMPTTKSSANS